MASASIYHIPVCPFSQRVEVLLGLKGRRGDVDFSVVDITQPRPDRLLKMTRGTTALPVLDAGGGRIIKESMVILRYFEDVFPDPPVAQRDPYRRAVEGMMTAKEGPFTAAGYRLVMNQDPARRGAMHDSMLALFADLDDFLVEYNPDGVWLFEEFGFVEAVFTPMFVRFWFLEYYEGFALPDEPRFARVRRWREACLAHPAAQQVGREEVIKVYYDYAKGAGNGALLPGRSRSSFVFEPHWSQRPWPPADKYGHSASDAELGLAA